MKQMFDARFFWHYYSQMFKATDMFYPWLIVILLVATNIQGSAQNVIFVNQVATGTNDGSSWSNAYTSLQDAIDAAIPGDQIWVAKGVYLPTKKQGGTNDRHKTFYINKNVEIYGGFDGAEASLELRNVDANVTILSGDLDGNDVDNDGNNIAEIYTDLAGENAYHVVWFWRVAQGSRLDGFVITAGDGLQIDAVGGGIYNRVDTAGVSSNPVIVHCKIVGNRAKIGGGLYNQVIGSYINAEYVPYGKANIRVLDCLFSGNFAASAGGAVYNSSVNHDTLNTLIDGCTLEKNIADHGGAIYNMCIISEPLSQPKISNCVLSDNLATSYGGGIYNVGFRGWADPLITGCVFYNNGVTTTSNFSGGGAIFNTTVTYVGASPILLNNTFFGNFAANGNGNAIYSYANFSAYTGPRVINCVFWGNSPGQGDAIVQENASDNNSGLNGLSNFRLKYSIIEENDCPPLVHCDSTVLFNQYPFFSSEINGDFHLQSGSPAIDAGDNSVLPTDFVTDLDGNPRIFNATGQPVARVDLGAYELNSVVAIQDPIKANGKLTVAPNPVVTEAYISLLSEDAGAGILKIFSSSGQLALEQGIFIQAGANFFPFSTEPFLAGVYTVQVILMNKEVISGIFVKSK